VGCHTPLYAKYLDEPNEKGNMQLTFTGKKGVGEWFPLPCGKCLGCRLEKSRQWAVRMMYEAKLHENNSFITLTYSPDHLPSDSSLDKKHFQDFMKRLRKRLGKKIRFFHCGEYGSKFRRPHYHAIIFGYDFPDKEVHAYKDGNYIYKSKLLSEIWGKGFCTIGEVTLASAQYVARYVTKKINISAKTPDELRNHYLQVDKETGEITGELTPEYATMSRRPGLARDWFNKYKSDCYPSDFIVIRGMKMKPPVYFDALLKEDDPEMYRQVKKKRRENYNKEEMETRRLMAKQKTLEAQFKRLERSFENEQ
jgi:hypothetical protein